jgi:hypothetical protein
MLVTGMNVLKIWNKVVESISSFRREGRALSSPSGALLRALSGDYELYRTAIAFDGSSGVSQVVRTIPLAYSRIRVLNARIAAGEALALNDRGDSYEETDCNRNFAFIDEYGLGTNFPANRDSFEDET